MSSFSLMDIGASALLANQALLTTAGNNIANVNTPGYSAETAQLSAQTGPNTGSGYFGTGVNIASVQRTYSQFLATAANQAQSISASDSARSSLQNQLQQSFPIGSGGLGSSINTVFSDYTNLASNPTDSAARTTLLSDLNNLSANFNTTSTQLGSLQTQVSQQMGSDAQQVSSLATQIAQLNLQIQQQSASGQPPNTLLDQRDQLISKLNKYVQTSTVVAADGSFGVFIAGGQPLVIGANAATMSVAPSTSNSAQSALQLTLPGGQTATLNPAYLGGGDLNGLMQFQNNDLGLAQNTIGQMALATASMLNTQQNLGNGNTGTPLFNLTTSGTATGSASGTSFGWQATPDASNALSPFGAPNFAAVPASASMGYSVQYSASASSWTLTNLQNPSDTTTLAGTSSLTGTLDGLAFTINAPTSTSDMLTLNPYATAAAQIQTAIISPQQISATPLSIGFSSSAPADPVNPLVVGPLTAMNASASATVNPSVSSPVTITFTSPTTYTISGNGSSAQTGQTYTATGQSITIPNTNWQVALSGVPATGDTLTIQPLQAAGDTPLATLGGGTLNGSYATALANIGTLVQSGSTAATLSASMATSATQAASNVSGVNLDEEASKLLQYQQSYQAAAKILSIAGTIFDSLIQAVR